MIRKVLSFLNYTLRDVFLLIRSPMQGLKALYGISLYRNAVYLMLNNVTVQATGFFFWMAAARLYSVEAVGLASAAIAAMTLVATLSTLGLDYSLIRFLPNAGNNARDMINTCFTIGGVSSLVLALIYIVGLDFWSPALVPIRQHSLFLVVFVASAVMTTLNIFAQQTFIAKRRAGLALTRGLFFGLSRFVPLVVMAAFFQSFGIFTAWGIAVSLAVAVSLLFISRNEADYYPLPAVSKEVIRDMFRFSFTNYISSLFLNMPTWILPLIVINLLGAEQNAYFYIAWAFGQIIFLVSIALAMSLFAEGSHDQESLHQDVRRSLKMILLVLVPAMVVMLLVGDKLLLIFGPDYSENASDLLRLLVISALPQVVILIYFSVKRVEMKMGIVTGLSLFRTVIVLGLTWSLLPLMGIEGVGVAWLAGQAVIALIVGWKLWR